MPPWTRTLRPICDSGYSLSIPPYVKRAAAPGEAGETDSRNLAEVWDGWDQQGQDFWAQMDALVGTLDGLVPDATEPPCKRTD